MVNSHSWTDGGLADNNNTFLDKSVDKIFNYHVLVAEAQEKQEGEAGEWYLMW